MIGDGKGIALLHGDWIGKDMPSHHEVGVTLAGKLGLGSDGFGLGHA